MAPLKLPKKMGCSCSIAMFLSSETSSPSSASSLLVPLRPFSVALPPMRRVPQAAGAQLARRSTRTGPQTAAAAPARWTQASDAAPARRPPAAGPATAPQREWRPSLRGKGRRLLLHSMRVRIGTPKRKRSELADERSPVAT